MCGITGIWQRSGSGDADELGRRVTRMADALRHRGPDDGQAWVDAGSGMALGFRRLAIVDLSAAGRQPMPSASGRYTVVYNGEIYNAETLRPELTPAAGNWRGHSDTEVMLAAIEQWGLERALSRLAGMFALALWDSRERRLSLVRDRVGKKPLYWTLQDDTLLFGSELRALRAHPAFRAEIDRDAVALYLRHACFQAPHTIYRGVQQLPPGHLLTLSATGELRVEPYWRLADCVSAGHEKPFQGDLASAATALEDVLGLAVRERLVSDVPLGAFLSGGYDSSSVVALMQKASSRPVRTFTIGFRVEAYNEAQHAKAVAAYLGTDHTELYVTPEDALAVIPGLPDIYDEPFADASQVPTYLVSRLARQHVTVALSGDGGDEVLAGYNRYLQAERFRRLAGSVPRGARSLAASAMRAVSPTGWDRAFRAVPSRLRPAVPGDKLHKLAAVVAEDADGFYRKLTSTWQEPERIVPGSHEPATVITDPSVRSIASGFIERMQYLDTLTYLPSDILTKVDRASMAVSLEARSPLLDHRVIAFAWSLPLHLKVAGSAGKRVLREMLYRHVPRQLVDRPKMGFGVPIDRWLRGPLREWAESLLSEAHLKDTGLLAVEPVRTRWREHLSGRRNWQDSLWAVLMLQAWHERWARR